MAGVPGQEFRIGTVIGQSLSVLAKNFVPFAILYLGINAPSAIYALTQAGKPGGDEDTGVGSLTIAENFLGLIVAAAVTYAAVQELRGRHVSFGEFFGRGLAQSGAVIRVALLSGILLVWPSSPSSSPFSSAIRCGGSPYPSRSSSGRARSPACSAAPS